MPKAKTATAESKTQQDEQDLDEAIKAAESNPAPRRGRAPLVFGALEEQREFVNVVMWGREGSGKSTAAVEAANHGKILVINAEGGLKIRALRRQGINTANIALWPGQGETISHRSLDRLYRQIKSDLAADPDAWFAVVFDSLSEVVTALLGSVSDDRIKKASIIDPFEKFETNRNDYGTMYKMFRDLLRKFRDLPCHVILTALERRDEDEDTRTVFYGPDINPGIQKDLAGYVDIQIYHRAASKGQPFRALVRGIDKYRTKDRYGLLPDTLAEPNFSRILGYIEEELEESTDPIQATLRKPSKKKDETDNDDD